MLYPPANPDLVRWRSLRNLFLLRTWSQQPPQRSSTGENLVNSRTSQPHPFLADETFWLQAFANITKGSFSAAQIAVVFWCLSGLSVYCFFPVKCQQPVEYKDSQYCWCLHLLAALSLRLSFPRKCRSVCIFCSDKTRKDLLWGSMFINAEKINGMTFLLIIKAETN